MHRTEQVWLPELQLWAAKPCLHVPQHAASSRCSEQSPKVQLARAKAVDLTAPHAKEVVASSIAGERGALIDLSSPDRTSQSPSGSSPSIALQPPSCPICMSKP